MNRKSRTWNVLVALLMAIGLLSSLVPAASAASQPQLELTVKADHSATINQSNGADNGFEKYVTPYETWQFNDCNGDVIEVKGQFEITRHYTITDTGKTYNSWSRVQIIGTGKSFYSGMTYTLEQSGRDSFHYANSREIDMGKNVLTMVGSDGSISNVAYNYHINWNGTDLTNYKFEFVQLCTP